MVADAGYDAVGHEPRSLIDGERGAVRGGRSAASGVADAYYRGTAVVADAEYDAVGRELRG